ncbi:hypothetical protein SAMN06265182_1571 [Persephonella hydrogeniphila]|uniref:Uncharacterized protein n=1 Tax=Persephonella hydrogeniphila TaxID=198703 RepID=A0A285NKW4_9AQUI|nr:hypothetical protein [Persephonella hydrogeniphila]SNZ09573.1 hypothetical protein SAMN06265182_1571 [Persephonella hydrogeniphila]
MKKLGFALAVLGIFYLSYGGEKVNLNTIKDKKMIKCLSKYIKEHRTHVTMIINKNGERELHIPEEYVEYCKKKTKN